MSREHHVVAVTWRRLPLFLLWFTNDEDGVIIESAGRLRTFDSEDAARQFAGSRALQLADHG